MAGKRESSSAGKKSESAAKKAPDKSQPGPAPTTAGYESLLGDGQPGSEKLSAYLDGADEATRARVVTELQERHGNNFVQRMLVQRDEIRTGPSWESRLEHLRDGGSETGATEKEREQQKKNWEKWLNGAKSGVKEAVKIWSVSARLTEVKVIGPNAFGGRITGALPSGIVSAMVLGQGAPVNVSSAFARATAAAWSKWTKTANVPGLPWYPPFAAWAGGMAPPIPNTPSPLLLIAPSAHISSSTVASSITGSLGENASDEGAQEAVQKFADWLSISFTIWWAAAKVMFVMGKGPVPTFAPPYVPVGMVIGDAESYGPFLVAPSFGI